MTYKPDPVVTDDIILSNDLIELTEKLALNAHENWATQRIKEGWRYGPVRDDKEKYHPDLIPYEELAESEKEYDRKTCMETLKLIKKLGYEIKKIKD